VRVSKYCNCMYWWLAVPLWELVFQ
jgi:hypothetical protein